MKKIEKSFKVSASSYITSTKQDTFAVLLFSIGGEKFFALTPAMGRLIRLERICFL